MPIFTKPIANKIFQKYENGAVKVIGESVAGKLKLQETMTMQNTAKFARTLKKDSTFDKSVKP